MTRDYSSPYHHDPEEKLRLGIFLDRSEGKAAAMLLNTENGSYAFLTKGEHSFTGDDAEGLVEAVNQVCEDIQRWALESEYGDGVHDSGEIAKGIL